ncbi:MAG: hypothetical protein FWD66_09205 [Paludibacter sp.]|nr:hypothetical protein [Paludibacter sp.]
MPKEDFLTKHIEKFGQVIAALFRLRKKGQNTEIVTIGKQTIGQLLENPYPSTIELEYVAQIYNILGDSYTELLQNEEAQNSYKKSLVYYQKLSQKDKTFSFERENIIFDLKNKIKK